MRFLASFTDWEQLLHRAPARTTFDLGRLHRLLASLGDPHLGRPTLHVTGTKGKSSLTAMADAILRAHGMSTFRFLSPHVLTVRERLSIDGQPVTEAAFAGLVEQLRPQIERLRQRAPEDVPSFFEMMTVMGFLLATRNGVDALTLEVGLGGRLDATNVVDPTVCVVTGIALDHTRILGDTLEKIAFEKVGILKPGRPVVTGLRDDHPGWPVLRARADELGCRVIAPGDGWSLESCEEALTDDGGPLIRVSGTAGGRRLDRVPMHAGPPHQAENALMAVTACEVLLEAAGVSVDDGCIADALAGLRMPGRSHWIPGTPPILVDGAHTTESVAEAGKVARRMAAGRPLHLLCGLTRDRDPRAVLGSLLDSVASITTTRLSTPRSLGADALAAALRAGFPPGVTARSDVDEALGVVLENAIETGGVVLVVGSLYLAGAVLKSLQ